MGTSWRGLFKIGGDGQQDVLIELQPKKAVHNKLVKNIILNSFSNKSSLYLKQQCTQRYGICDWGCCISALYSCPIALRFIRL
jgi:hypothetical protein